MRSATSASETNCNPSAGPFARISRLAGSSLSPALLAAKACASGLRVPQRLLHDQGKLSIVGHCGRTGELAGDHQVVGAR